MDRDELHERVMLLKEEIEAGRVKFVEGLGVIDSLQKVRLGSDGKIDPGSVDGLVRSLALGVSYGRFRREAKKFRSESRNRNTSKSWKNSLAWRSHR
jgi:hypothetical protein